MATWKKVVVESTAGNISQKAATSGTADNIISQGALATLATVGTVRIDNGAVTTDKLSTSAVTNAKLANDAVDADKIADEAVTGAKIESGAIESTHLNAAVIDDGQLIADDVIDSNHYASGSIDAAHLASNSVTNVKVADDAIGVAELSATGTASSSTYLRGDNSWATVSQVTVDTAITNGSNNPVTNNAVHDALALKLDATGGFTGNRAIVSTAGGSLGVLDVTSTEVGYLDGVTSSIQTQLNGKQASGSYAAAAGSSSQNFATNNLVVSDNLTVSGTSTTVNTETIELADNTILLNSNESGTPSADAGLVVERGTSANKAFIWDESGDAWSIGHTEAGTAGETTFSVVGKMVAATKSGANTEPTGDSNGIGCIQVNNNDDIWIRVD